MTKIENGSKVRQILFNEISLIIAVIGVAIGMTMFIVRPDNQMGTDIELIKKDIQIINTNHIKHIEEDLDSIEKQLIEYGKTLIRIESKLNMHTE